MTNIQNQDQAGKHSKERVFGMVEKVWERDKRQSSKELEKDVHQVIRTVKREQSSPRLQKGQHPSRKHIKSLAGKAGSLEKPLSWQELRDIAREDGIKHKNQPK